MFSFDGIELSALPLVVLPKGTNHVYMTKIVYNEPPNKDGRTEITLERRAPGSRIERAILYQKDCSIKGFKYKDQQKHEMSRLFEFLLTYRPDLDENQVRTMVGPQETWKDLVNKVISLLPPDFATIETSWHLKYDQGSDFMTVPNPPPMVKRGDVKFKSDPTRDFYEPTVKPTPASEFAQPGSEFAAPVTGGSEFAPRPKPAMAGGDDSDESDLPF